MSQVPDYCALMKYLMNYFLVSGRLRTLGISPLGLGQVTLGVQDDNDLIGWLSLLRSQPSEFVQCSTEVCVLVIEASWFMSHYFSNELFSNYFNNKSSLSESFGVACSKIFNSSYSDKNWEDYLLSNLELFSSTSISCDARELPPLPSDEFEWCMSTPGIVDYDIGQAVVIDNLPLPKLQSFNLPFRLVALPKRDDSLIENSVIRQKNTSQDIPSFYNSDQSSLANLESLGIFEPDIDKSSRFPSHKNAASDGKYYFALIQLLCDYLKVPLKRDLALKLVEQQLKRNKGFQLMF